MAKQTRQAVAEADAVVFVVDVRRRLSAQDHDIVPLPAQTTGKRAALAVNKAEGMSESPRWRVLRSWAGRAAPSRPLTVRAFRSLTGRRWAEDFTEDATKTAPTAA